MNLIIEEYNVKLTSEKNKGDAALDYLWQKEWLKNSLGKKDRNQIDDLNSLANKLLNISEIMVIISTGCDAAMIKAALDAEPVKHSVIVFGDSLSAGHYAELINQLEGKEFSLIAISTKEESRAFKAAFACLRKLLIEKYGPSGAGARIVTILGHHKGYLEGEASRDDVRVISLPENADDLTIGNTAAVLLPLALSGGNIEDYLDGFENMLADPIWDLDGIDYGLALGTSVNGGFSGKVTCFQKEMENISEWMETIYEVHFNTTDIKTLLYLEKERNDIALPSFPGCNSDGSLNLLLKEEMIRMLSSMDDSQRAVKITVPELSSYNFGQLVAFVQLSLGISTFILDN